LYFQTKNQSILKIFVAGHRGMVGSAVVRSLQHSTHEVITATRDQVNLLDQKEVLSFLESVQPDAVVDAAARVGGILANNTFPYNFLLENLGIQQNLIQSSVTLGIKKFIFLGSSCIYPKHAQQPITEDALLTGPLEPTNEWYAIAKIAGVKATEAVRKQFGWDYVSLMPTNLYGPGDNFDLNTSHVLPAMIRKFHEAKSSQSPVELWGTGSPYREFLHVDDLAQAVHYAIDHSLPENLYNVGYGTDLSIRELAELIQKTTGHAGAIQWDANKPDGTPKKLMDSSKLRALGWSPKIALESGIESTYAWFLTHRNEVKEVKITS
jgi:GDP-L-fucose synthase